jgi:hypothetical protein
MRKAGLLVLMLFAPPVLSLVLFVEIQVRVVRWGMGQCQL